MEDSTSRAIYGEAETTKATIVALVPNVVPTIKRVNGEIASNRIINGTERSI